LRGWKKNWKLSKPNSLNFGVSLNRVDLLYWFLAAACVALIWSLPVFPSQDGAIHVYFADVMRVLAADPAAYHGHFEIRQWVTPYALQTYLLIALLTLLPGLAAEKAFVTICVLLFLTGFRALTLSLNPRARAGALIAVPFAFHRALYFGFYNFSLGFGMLLWMAAVWNRCLLEKPGWKIARILLPFWLLAITHPVSSAAGLVLGRRPTRRHLTPYRGHRSGFASTALAACRTHTQVAPGRAFACRASFFLRRHICRVRWRRAARVPNMVDPAY
jgi:hypothetical protein